MDKYVDSADCKDGRSVGIDNFGTLRADCDSCFGLCCIALYFSASDGFPNDKRPGIPCGYLQPDFRCAVHQQLTQKGFKGCRDYDCFGAGQKVSQLTFAGTDWIAKPESAPQMFEVFLIMQQLHELLWYLTEALALPTTSPIHDEIGTMIGKTLGNTILEPSALSRLDMAVHRGAVDKLLKTASVLLRSTVRDEFKIDAGRQKKFRHRAVLMAANLRHYDLRGVDLRGACLIAADLRESELIGTDLIGADFRDADVRGTDLSRSLFLTQNQINSAKGDAGTKLPSFLIRPEHWDKESGGVIINE